MFYLSERRVVKALMEAAGRGASIRLVLDPNKDAFRTGEGWNPESAGGRGACARSDGRIKVRWYDTHGEQFHTKLFMVTRGDSVIIMGGSANLTRRNIEGFQPGGRSPVRTSQGGFSGLLRFDLLRDGFLK